MTKIAPLLLVLAVVTPAQAATSPSRIPTAFASISAEVQAGDVVELICDEPAVGPKIFTEAGTWTSAAGGGWAFFSLGSVGDHVYVDAKVGVVPISHDITEQGDGYWGGFGYRAVFEESGALRSALAAWGGQPMPCRYEINGVVAGDEVDPAAATFLRPSDFTMGAGVGTQLAVVAPALALQQEVDGFVFTVIPTFGFGAGAAAAVAPDGSAQAHPFGIAVASGADGTWTYAVSEAAIPIRATPLIARISAPLYAP
jgi:hypothetical protein